MESVVIFWQMNLRSRQPVRLLLLIVAAALPALGTAQLNPTVNVLPRATTPVPAECLEGVAQQPVVRLAPEERVAVVRDTAADMKPPPSATLRAEVQIALEAAQSGSRDVFRDSLSRAKKMLTDYPPGAERSTATDVVAVFDDLDKLWDYQFTSPTGSFFDAGTDVYRVLARYSGYEMFIRRQVLLDGNGTKFYPTRESRDFLTQEAAARFARLTGRPLPARPPARERVIQSQRRALPPTPVVKPKQRPKTHEARVTSTPPAPRRLHHATTTAKKSATPATTTTAVTTSSTPPPPPPAVATTEPAPTTTTTSTPAPPPITTTTEGPSATTATTTTTEPTTITIAESTASTESAAQPKKRETSGSRRNFVIPVLLILVGVGVLVVLFRTSS